MQHQVTVTLKLMQVYVTDKKGNPVVDLEKDDFIIYDNGTEKDAFYLKEPSTPCLLIGTYLAKL